MNQMGVSARHIEVLLHYPLTVTGTALGEGVGAGHAFVSLPVQTEVPREIVVLKERVYPPERIEVFA